MRLFKSARVGCIIAATIVLATPLSGADAAPITYETTGTVGNGDGYIQFIGTQGTIADPTNATFSLGQFQILPIGANSSLDNWNEGFEIFLRLSGAAASDGNSPILDIKGSLSGSLITDQTSDEKMYISSIQQIFSDPLPFPLSALSVSAPTLSPPGINDGLTSVTAQLGPPGAPAPEPAASALLALAFTWVFLRRRGLSSPLSPARGQRAGAATRSQDS